MKKNLIAAIIASTMMLAACGSDSSDPKTDNEKPINPPIQQQTNVNRIQILDANHQPIAKLTVKVASAKSLGIQYQRVQIYLHLMTFCQMRKALVQSL